MERDSSGAGEASGTFAPGFQSTSMRQFHKVFTDLEELVQDLAADIETSRRRKRLTAKMVVVLKKDTLEKYEIRLQRTAQILGLAHQIHMETMISRQPHLIATEVANALTAKMPPLDDSETWSKLQEARVATSELPPPFKSSNLRPVTHQSQGKHQTRRMQDRLGLFAVEQKQSDGQVSSASKTTKYRIRFSPPRWLLDKAWDLQVSVASSGWDVCLRQYITMPEDSPVFKYAFHGNLSELLELFAGGQASPFMFDKRGRTLLHYAVHAESPETFEKLMDMGLNAVVADSGGYTPLWYMTQESWSMMTLQDRIKLHRLLCSHSTYGEYDEDHIPGFFLTNAETFEWYLADRIPDFHKWGLEQRFHLATKHCSRKVLFDPAVFRRMLRPDDQQFCSNDLQYSHTFAVISNLYFETSASYYQHLFLSRNFTPEHHEILLSRWIEYRAMLRDAVFALSPAFPITRLTKPTSMLTVGLVCFCYYTDLLWRNKRGQMQTGLQQAVRYYLEDLQSCGVDLMEYGKAEMAHFMEIGAICDGRWTRWGKDKAAFMTFTYGPQPGDWVIIWDPLVEVFAGTSGP
ncbi:hypothetical protein B0T17DRAFT_252429 [Bombardia bombarda]|uniref:Uncharacterized protein n=1 Tax=Bombardia bombarda TaxID=252184 RepID=A0AA40C4I4_9PEZI|nr:hypothetical protein B0T17DRAFT_252429 [Bombardia bombarda]